MTEAENRTAVLGQLIIENKATEPRTFKTKTQIQYPVKNGCKCSYVSGTVNKVFLAADAVNMLRHKRRIPSCGGVPADPGDGSKSKLLRRIHHHVNYEEPSSVSQAELVIRNTDGGR